jgi:hypothetical protein
MTQLEAKRINNIAFLKSTGIRILGIGLLVFAAASSFRITKSTTKIVLVLFVRLPGLDQ